MSERGRFGGMPKLSKLAKINLSWALTITAGLATFIVARNAIQDERRQRMRLKKRIEEQVLQEREEELAARDQARVPAEK